RPRRPPPSHLFPYTTLFRSAISGRQVDEPVAVRIRDPEAFAHRNLRHDDRFLTHPRRCVLDADHDGRFRIRGDTRQAAAYDRRQDRKSTRLNSSHLVTSYAV